MQEKLVNGAAATQVEIFKDTDVKMELEYYEQAGDIYFISTQTILTDIAVANAAQMVFLTESMTEMILKAFVDEQN